MWWGSNKRLHSDLLKIKIKNKIYIKSMLNIFHVLYLFLYVIISSRGWEVAQFVSLRPWLKSSAPMESRPWRCLLVTPCSRARNRRVPVKPSQSAWWSSCPSVRLCLKKHSRQSPRNNFWVPILPPECYKVLVYDVT